MIALQSRKNLITFLLFSTKLTYCKRYMLKRTVNKTINPCSIEQISKSALGFLKVATNEHIISNIITNNTKPLLKNCLEYLGNKTDGLSPQIKNAMLSSAFPKGNFILHELGEVHRNLFPKSKICVATQGQIPTRVLGEMPILHNYAERYDKYIEQLYFTGDSEITSHKGQTHADVIQKLKYGSEGRTVVADIKSGNNMAKNPIGGTIGQLTYYNDNQLSTPNNFCDLVDFNTRRRIELRIINAHLDENPQMSSMHKEEFKTYYNEMQPLWELLEKNPKEIHMKLEEILIKIQCIPTMNRRLSFITVVNLSLPRQLSPQEELFIRSLEPLIDKNTFKNQKAFNLFLKKAFHVYQEYVDRQAIQNVKALKGTCWEFTFLDDIDTTIF